MFENGYDFGYHSDVLEANPTSPDAVQQLVAEIKNRAKGCITTRNFPVAIQLYTKACELTSDDLPACSIIHANRSMCHISMNQPDKALSDANKSIEMDPNYIKAYYRKAMALVATKNFVEAKDALIAGLNLKPDDKELKTQLTIVETEISRGNSISSTSNLPKSSPSNKPIEKSTSSNKVNEVKNRPTESSKSSTSQDDKDDEDEELRKLNMKGYKKTADGRITTFFNNELDENAKRLIGDIAPKKLDEISPDSQPMIVDPSNVPGSVWNSAGTYEEKILTPWASGYLKEEFERISEIVAIDKSLVTAMLPSSTTVHLNVTSVDNINGDAQITMIRGKKKHLCDYCFDVKLSLKLVVPSKTDVMIDAVVHVIDVTADKEYEINGVDVTTKGVVMDQKVINYYLKNNNSGIKPILHQKLMQFCEELKAK
eukprot:gene6624-9093_t